MLQPRICQIFVKLRKCGLYDLVLLIYSLLLQTLIIKPPFNVKTTFFMLINYEDKLKISDSVDFDQP